MMLDIIKIIIDHLTRLRRRHHIQLAYQVCSPPNVRWQIVWHGEIVAERGKTVVRHWPAGGCRPDHLSIPVSATLTPSSVGSGRPQP